MGIGAAIAGVVAVGSGLASSRAADKAQDSYNSAQAYLNKAFADATGYIKDMQGYWQGALSQWESVYGGLEKNLADYYTNLDPEKYATQYKTSIAENINKQLKVINESMAQTGIATSGMAMQAQKEAAYNQALGNAAADMIAPEVVARQQLAYFAPQQAWKRQMQSNEASTYGALANLSSQYGQAMAGQYNQMGNVYQQEAGHWGQAAGNLLGSAIGLGLGSGSGSLLGSLGSKSTPITYQNTMPKMPNLGYTPNNFLG